MNPKVLQYYLEHGPMTKVADHQEMIANIPQDITIIVKYVQNILLHQHWSRAYGVELTPERQRELLLRSFEEKLAFLRAKGFRHVSDQRATEEKMVGICRDFSVVAAALCRTAGIPARARCGFATYFEPGKYTDHWVMEYWNAQEGRWVMVDAQLDELQQKTLEITFDPFDLGPEHFFTGPRAWILGRSGQVDPNLFGIFQWWGLDYLSGNLILDVNSLLKVPLQPWDGWKGYKSLPTSEWSAEDFAVMDQLAELALAVDTDFDTFAEFVRSNEKIRVPDDLGEVFD